MSSKQERFRVAVLDDYQNVAFSLADWSVLDGRATVTVFNDHLVDSDAVVERLKPFDIVCVMRERTPMTRGIIERLLKLRLIASTATRNASIDLEAAEERGVHSGERNARHPGSPSNKVAAAVRVTRAGSGDKHDHVLEPGFAARIVNTSGA
jgi:phosphoglycerate dehydrogenase-like enzyme